MTVLRGGRGTTKRGANTQAGDAREDDRWGGLEIGWVTDELEYMPSSRPQNVLCHQMVYGTLRVVFWGRGRGVDRCI